MKEEEIVVHLKSLEANDVFTLSQSAVGKGGPASLPRLSRAQRQVLGEGRDGIGLTTGCGITRASHELATRWKQVFSSSGTPGMGDLDREQ
jgi:hypothetical protein